MLARLTGKDAVSARQLSLETGLHQANALNRTGFVGGLIPREDEAHGTTQQVLPRTL